jgi:tRNA(Arg) A34 adenosine deaminase TadA
MKWFVVFCLSLAVVPARAQQQQYKTRYPRWLTKIVKPGQRYSDRKLMQLAIKVSDANSRHGGGPFGAIVATRSGRVVAIGNNRVVPSSDPTAHGEVKAIRRACKECDDFRLNRMKLFTSAAPCIMCTGAIHWAGIEKVYAGARKSDVEAIGFVEGPQRFDPAQFFKERGIQYKADYLRPQAVNVLKGYAGRQGQIYNGNDNN